MKKTCKAGNISTTLGDWYGYTSLDAENTGLEGFRACLKELEYFKDPLGNSYKQIKDYILSAEKSINANDLVIACFYI